MWSVLENTPLCMAVKIVVVIRGSKKFIELHTLYCVHCASNQFYAPLYAHDRITWVISGLRREINEICALLGYYAANVGICLPTLRDNLLGLIFNFVFGFLDLWRWDRQVSVSNYQHTLSNIPLERNSQWKYMLYTHVNPPTRFSHLKWERIEWIM